MKSQTGNAADPNVTNRTEVEKLLDRDLPDRIDAAPEFVTVLVVSAILLGVIYKSVSDLLKDFVRLTWSATRWFHNRRRVEAGGTAERTSQFAIHLANHLNKLADSDDWTDERHAELSAEIEVRNSRHRKFPLYMIDSPTTSLRRVRSLSDALGQSDGEKLIVLRGDPGSGKSIALRHLAAEMLRAVTPRQAPDTVLPLYINLRDFRPLVPSMPGSNDLDAFIKNYLDRGNSRDVTAYINDHLDDRRKAGKWLYLFDSFDEIPAVVGARDDESIIPAYESAIGDFMNTFNGCRAVLASRDFRGPGTLNWANFRVAPLGRDQQRTLIERSGLSPDAVRMLWSHLLTTSGTDLDSKGRNPMYLGILAAYVLAEGTVPESTHELYELFLMQRMEKDGPQHRSRLGVSTEEVLSVALVTAFAMNADATLTLSGTGDDIRRAIDREGLDAGQSLDSALQALAYSKILRSEGLAAGSQYAFAHRRFQEHLAASSILSGKVNLDLDTLLSEGRWREVAANVLSVGDSSEVATIVDKLTTSFVDAEVSELDLWPGGLLHAAGIAEAGLRGRSDLVGDNFTRRAEVIAANAYDHGDLLDRRWALGVASVASLDFKNEFFDRAMSDSSMMVRDEALRMVGVLGLHSTQIQLGVAEMAIQAAEHIASRRDLETIDAQIARSDALSRVRRNASTVGRARSLLTIAWIAFAALALTTPGWLSPTRILFGTFIGLVISRAIFARLSPVASPSDNIGPTGPGRDSIRAASDFMLVILAIAAIFTIPALVAKSAVAVGLAVLISSWSMAWALLVKSPRSIVQTPHAVFLVAPFAPIQFFRELRRREFRELLGLTLEAIGVVLFLALPAALIVYTAPFLKQLFASLAPFHAVLAWVGSGLACAALLVGARRSRFDSLTSTFRAARGRVTDRKVISDYDQIAVASRSADSLLELLNTLHTTRYRLAVLDRVDFGIFSDEELMHFSSCAMRDFEESDIAVADEIGSRIGQRLRAASR